MKPEANAFLLDIPSFVAELSERIRMRNDDAQVILVGGSAFEFHFRPAHASLDADLCVTLFSRERDKILTAVLNELGFTNTGGRIYSNKATYFTVDIVGTDVFVEGQWLNNEIEEHLAPSGKRFFILSATAMIFDRLAAWGAWKDAESLRKIEIALKTSFDKIQKSKLKQFLSKEPSLLKKASHELDKDSLLYGLLFK